MVTRVPVTGGSIAVARPAQIGPNPLASVPAAIGELAARRGQQLDDVAVQRASIRYDMLLEQAERDAQGLAGPMGEGYEDALATARADAREEAQRLIPQSGGWAVQQRLVRAFDQSDAMQAARTDQWLSAQEDAYVRDAVDEVTRYASAQVEDDWEGRDDYAVDVRAAVAALPPDQRDDALRRWELSSLEAGLRGMIERGEFDEADAALRAHRAALDPGDRTQLEGWLSRARAAAARQVTITAAQRDEAQYMAGLEWAATNPGQPLPPGFLRGLPQALQDDLQAEISGSPMATDYAAYAEFMRLARANGPGWVAEQNGVEWMTRIGGAGDAQAREVLGIIQDSQLRGGSGERQPSTRVQTPLAQIDDIFDGYGWATQAMNAREAERYNAVVGAVQAEIAALEQAKGNAATPQEVREIVERLTARAFVGGQAIVAAPGGFVGGDGAQASKVSSLFRGAFKPVNEAHFEAFAAAFPGEKMSPAEAQRRYDRVMDDVTAVGESPSDVTYEQLVALLALE